MRSPAARARAQGATSGVTTAPPPHPERIGAVKIEFENTLLFEPLNRFAVDCCAATLKLHEELHVLELLAEQVQREALIRARARAVVRRVRRVRVERGLIRRLRQVRRGGVVRGVRVLNDAIARGAVHVVRRAHAAAALRVVLRRDRVERVPRARVPRAHGAAVAGCRVALGLLGALAVASRRQRARIHRRRGRVVRRDEVLEEARGERGRHDDATGEADGADAADLMIELLSAWF